MVVAGGYGTRGIGLGSDEFRRMVNGAGGFALVVVVISYLTQLDLSRIYVVIAVPWAGITDLTCRYLLRKHRHSLRSHGSCMQRVVAVGHAAPAADLVGTLTRAGYLRLCVVAARLPGELSGDAR